MSQQINLYSAPVKTSLWQASRPFPQLAVVLVVLLSVVYGFFWFRYQQVDSNWQQAKQDHDRYQQQMEAMLKVRSQAQPDNGQQQEMLALETRIKGQQGLLATLKREGLTVDFTFSDYLTGLARQKPEGVWFSNIAFYQSGRHVLLEGKALSADLVPQLISSLGEYSAFSMIRFEQASINQPTNTEPVTFNLGSLPTLAAGGRE